MTARLERWGKVFGVLTAFVTLLAAIVPLWQAIGWNARHISTLNSHRESGETETTAILRRLKLDEARLDRLEHLHGR